jgi:hypothetical protein
LINWLAKKSVDFKQKNDLNSAGEHSRTAHDNGAKQGYGRKVFQLPHGVGH